MLKFRWDNDGEIQTWGTDADGVELQLPDDFALYGPAKYVVVDGKLVARQDWQEPKEIITPAE